MKKVIVNGAFDILHSGHIKLLRYAKSLGDYLLVAIDTDSRIRELKGKGRPINNILDRINLLSAIRYVDKVDTFSSDQELVTIIREFQPDIMVKGSDYKGKHIVGGHLVPLILYMERTDESTTQKIESITSRGLLL